MVIKAKNFLARLDQVSKSGQPVAFRNAQTLVASDN